MATAKPRERSYLDVWGKMFKEPWSSLLHEVANMPLADAEQARLVVGAATPETPEEAPAGSQPGAYSPAPRPPFRRPHMPPSPGAPDD